MFITSNISNIDLGFFIFIKLNTNIGPVWSKKKHKYKSKNIGFNLTSNLASKLYYKNGKILCNNKT